MSNHPSSSASSSATSLPKVALIATGGTIAGVAPTPLEQISYQAGVLTVDSMLETLPGIEGVARITSVQCGNLPSENITPEHWAMLGEQCAKALDDPEICGVVLTHGTDTLEESAFYLHLTLASPKPVVLTGSMRPSTSLSADGPINIRDAVAVAACPQAQARGALLVMNSRVLSARTAVKVATLDVEAFRALESGCLGRVINGEPQFYYGGEEDPALAGTFAELAGRKNLPRVDVIYGCAGMPVDLVRYSVERSAGIVLAGMGNGSMPDAVRHELRQAIAGGIPVIRCSRTGSGPVTPLDEYEGFVPGGMLSPAKARVLLMLALEQQKNAEPAQRMLSVREVFALGAKL